MSISIITIMQALFVSLSLLEHLVLGHISNNCIDYILNCESPKEILLNSIQVFPTTYRKYSNFKMIFIKLTTIVVGYPLTFR